MMLPCLWGKKQTSNKIITNQRVKQNFRQRAHSKGRHIDIQIILFTVHKTRQLKKIRHSVAFNSSLLLFKSPIFVQLLNQFSGFSEVSTLIDLLCTCLVLNASDFFQC